MRVTGSIKSGKQTFSHCIFASLLLCSKQFKTRTLIKLAKYLELAARTKYKITHYTALSLLFLTGMRIGELRALRWESDIDFENEIIHIRRSKDRFGPRSPKTKNSYRTFPMNENIKSILLGYKE